MRRGAVGRVKLRPLLRLRVMFVLGPGPGVPESSGILFESVVGDRVGIGLWLVELVQTAAWWRGTWSSRDWRDRRAGRVGRVREEMRRLTFVEGSVVISRMALTAKHGPRLGGCLWEIQTPGSSLLFGQQWQVRGQAVFAVLQTEVFVTARTCLCRVAVC